MRYVIAAGLFTIATPIGAQVTIDKVLVRIHGDIVTLSDVRQARLLKLFGARPDSDMTDAALQRELENRRLLLAEVARAAVPEPLPEAGAARYQAIVGALGPAADLPRLLDRAGMSEGALMAWCRDDLRIDALLAQRFGSLPPESRANAQAVWIDELRRRAGLR